jgi:hypothetical protein
MSVYDKAQVEMLKASKKIGYLQHVVVDQDGKVLIGRHRKYADANWPEVKIDVKDDLHRLLIMLNGNVQRVVSKQETKMLLNKIAVILQARGIAKERVCSEISKLEGMPYVERWIRELIDDDYKMQAKKREFAEVLPQVEQNVKQESATIKGALIELESTLAMPEASDYNARTNMLPFPDCACKTCHRSATCYG